MPSPAAHRAPWLAALLGPLGAVALTLQPKVLTGSWLIGGGTADMWGHTWGYGWTARALRHGQVPLLQAPVAFPELQSWWVIDLPVAALLAPVTALGGASLTYNLAFLLHIAAGAWGFTRLLLHHRVAPGLAALAAVVGCLSPFVRGAMISGVPEALSVLLTPLLMIWLTLALDGSRRHLAAAAVLAPMLVLDGAYGAAAGALGCALVVGMALLGQAPRWHTLLRSAMVAAPAGLAFAGLREAMRFTDHPVLERASRRIADIGPHWVLQPLGGADLLAFVKPAALFALQAPPTGHRHIVYVGVLMPIFALFGLRHRPARPYIILGAITALLCLGPALHIGGVAVPGITLPGALLWSSGATNLYRLAGLVPLAGIAALVIGSRSRWLPTLALVLIAAEWFTGAPLRLKVATTADPAGPVEAWMATQPRGGVLDLPFDREDTSASGPHPQRTFHLQTHHHHPIASALYAQAPMHGEEPAIGAFDRAIRAGWRLANVPDTGSQRASPDVPPPPLGGARTDLLAHLHRMRFGMVTLDLALVHPDQRDGARTWALSWLGEPDAEAEGRMAWTLPKPSGAPPSVDLMGPHSEPPPRRDRRPGGFKGKGKSKSRGGGPPPPR